MTILNLKNHWRSILPRHIQCNCQFRIVELNPLLAIQVAAIQGELSRRREVMEILQSSVSLTVSSVDAYQGREADAVIFSATRNNRTGRIGFLKDPRRLNVAITRPRRALIVIAAPHMLDGDKNWGRRAPSIILLVACLL
jgi:hypothetical protein